MADLIFEPLELAAWDMVNVAPQIGLHAMFLPSPHSSVTIQAQAQRRHSHYNSQGHSQAIQTSVKIDLQTLLCHTAGHFSVCFSSVQQHLGLQGVSREGATDSASSS